MLDNLYTTKMSAGKKTLQNRFIKIRYKNGRLSKMLAIITSMAIATIMLYSTAVMAIIDKQETKHVNNNSEIQRFNPVHSSQNFRQIELYKPEANSTFSRENKLEAYDKTIENESAKVETEKQNIVLSGDSIAENSKNSNINSDLNQTITDDNKIKSTFVSDELYAGFEQIVLTNTNSVKLQEELNNNGISQSQNSSVNLQKNYVVRDFSEDKTQVMADENGNISIYVSVDTDNLFDIQITDAETNENVGGYGVLANNENAYTFIGFDKNKLYNVEVNGKAKSDWDIKGNYIIY